MMNERVLAGGALGVALLATVIKLQVQLVPAELVPSKEPSQHSALMTIIRDTPPGPQERVFLEIPMPVTPGENSEKDLILSLLGETDPYSQLWALEAACWMHTFAHESAMYLAYEGIRNTSSPRAQVAGVAILGCTPSRQVSIPQLSNLLDGRHGEVVAVAAALELARLSATEKVGAVSKVSAQVSDDGLALLADWAAWSLGHPDERFTALTKKGL